MVSIADATVRHNVYETIYDLLNSGKGSWGASSTPDIRGGFPDFTSVSIPVVVLSPIWVGKEGYTVDGVRSVNTKTIVAIITIFTKDNKDLDYIADGVCNTIETSTFSGITLVSVGDDDGAPITPADNKVKVKTLTFTFMRR